MNRWLVAAAWTAFVVLMYLILTEALWPWYRLPELGNIGFTFVFVLFAVLHCAALEGCKRMAVFFAASAVISYLMEAIGVRTGAIFGAYHHSEKLGWKLGGVPAVIPLAWFMMIYPSWMVAKALLRGIDTYAPAGLTAQAVVAAMVMTAWDVVMDPGMGTQGIWVWERGGDYFGVPARNYLGWLLTTFPVYWIVEWIWRSIKCAATGAGIFSTLPIIVYAFFAMRYVTSNRFPALRVVALFAMGLPGLVALLRVFLSERTESV